jgi:hypothetical protein
VELDKVTFKQRHSYIDPAVFTLEVEGKGLYFAQDVYLDYDEETYVIPYSDKIRTPRDVHAACQAFLLRSGRAVS